MIAHDPLHGSGRAALPHPALALGDDAHAAQRIGMTDSRRRQPAGDEAPHTIPEDAAILTAPRQRAMPEPPYLEPKYVQRVLVQGHTVISDVSTHHRLQPFTHFGDGFVHASLKLGFHLVQLRLQPLAYRLPQHRKPSIAPLLHADMREAEKVERLRFPFSTPLPLVDRIRTELQQSRFLGMQFQVELPHSFREFHPKLIGIRFLSEIQPRYRQQNARRSRLRALASDAMLGPTGRIRSEGRRSPKAARHCRPGASLPPLVFVSHPPARRRSAISG